MVSVDLFFSIAIAADLISKDRPSNKVDLAYIYYLPFCMVFTSSDKLHDRVVPLFLKPDQTYVPGYSLKADLKRIDDYFSALPEEVKRRGIMKFAHYPPDDKTLRVTQLWNQYLPKWRANSQRELNLDEKREQELVSDLNEKVKNLETKGHHPASPSDIDPETADHVIFKRVVPGKRGKWQIVPPEVEKRQRK